MIDINKIKDNVNNLSNKLSLNIDSNFISRDGYVFRDGADGHIL